LADEERVNQIERDDAGQSEDHRDGQSDELSPDRTFYKKGFIGFSNIQFSGSLLRQ
jgi:hypothetical protein